MSAWAPTATLELAAADRNTTCTSRSDGQDVECTRRRHKLNYKRLAATSGWHFAFFLQPFFCTWRWPQSLDRSLEDSSWRVARRPVMTKSFQNGDATSAISEYTTAILQLK